MTSLTAISHLMQANLQLDDLRQRLNKTVIPLSNEIMLTISTQLQPLYKKLLITNLDEALSRQLEIGLWNDCFRTPLTRFGKTDKNLFHLMIENGVGFYLGLIQDIGIHFDISFITNATSTNKLYCTKTSQSPLVSPSKASVYYIIQNCLLHVGDLLRYRGSFPEAMKMYDKSSAVCPANGYPYHQMGITQLLISGNDDYTTMNNFVATFYYFARSLSVSNPHLQSYHEFNSITEKILGMPVGSNKYQEFIRQFLLMISSILRKDQLPSSITYNVVPMLSPLVTNQQIKPSILFQMICIALWTHWRLTYGGEMPCPQSEEAILEIIAATFNAILIGAVGLFGNDDCHFAQNNIDKRFSSAVHLKLLIDWLLRLYQNEAAGKQVRFFREKTHISTLLKVLNLIKGSTQNIDDDHNNTCANYILPEEKRLIGFLPLDYSNLRSSGALLLDENNPKTQNFRVQRLLQSAVLLSHPHFSYTSDTNYNFVFIEYDGTEFNEPMNSGFPLSPALLPNRRNVALTSIFRSGLSNSSGALDYGDGNNSNSSFCSGGLSPTNSSASVSPMALSMFSSRVSSSSKTTGHFLSLSNHPSNDPTDIFRSIWTPDNDTNTKVASGESAWN